MSMHFLNIERSHTDTFELAEIFREQFGNRIRIHNAHNVKTGLERLSSGKFDLIFLELCAQEPHGIETFRRIQDASPKTPIVLMTSLDSHDVANQALDEGAAGHYFKGAINDDILISKIEQALKKDGVTLAHLNQRTEFLLNLAGIDSRPLHDLALLLPVYENTYQDFKTLSQESSEPNHHIEFVQQLSDLTSRLLRARATPADLLQLHQAIDDKQESGAVAKAHQDFLLVIMGKIIDSQLKQ